MNEILEKILIGSVLLLFGLIFLFALFFLTELFLNQMNTHSCKDITFPDEERYKKCVLDYKCESKCDFDFDNWRCTDECKEYYGVEE